MRRIKNPEKELFCKIIGLAIEAAEYKLPEKYNPRSKRILRHLADKKDAQFWLFKDVVDFPVICSIAGVNWVKFRERLEKERQDLNG